MRKINQIDIMRYYVAYYDIEKEIDENIKSRDLNLRESAYHKYANSYMKIGRNFKPNSGAMVLTTLTNMIRNEGNLGVTELSNRLVQNELVSRPEIKNVKVAASKLLWLFDKDTIIMDNNNMKVLGAKDYNDYIEIWNREYQNKEQEIIEQIKSLNIKDEIFNQKWFRMRVFDMYLLSLFSENTKSNGGREL